MVRELRSDEGNDRGRLGKDYLNRRSVLKLTGSAAAAAVGTTAVSSVVADTDGDGDVIEINYDEFADPSDVYRVWSCSPGQASFTGDRAYSGQQGMEIALSSGGSCGTNTHFNVENELGYQPVEIHDSFMFRLSDNWRMNSNDQCKILRTAMSYSAGGGHSGGGNANGINGWSAGVVLANRGSGAQNGGPYNLSAYLYHMDSTAQDNDGYYGGGLIHPGEWYRIETHCKLNSIENGRAQNDGEYRIWVDGELIYERTNLRWTEDYNANAIEYSGPYIRYGGGETAPRNMAAYYDDHVMHVEGGIPEPEPPSGDFALELGGREDLNEYLLELDAETVEPGPNANTREHEYQDRAFERDGRWYVHGYTSSSGIDDFDVIDGEILRVGVLEGEVTVSADGRAVDIDEFDSIESIPDTTDSEPHDDLLLVDGVGTTGSSRYEFRVDGDVVKSTEQAATINEDDIIDSGHVNGSVAGWRDAYRFSGDLEELTVDGPAQVYLNGEKVDPSEYGDEMPHVLTVVGNGSESVYEATVDGEIDTLVSETAGDDIDALSDTSVSGTVERDVHRFRFSGELVDFTFTEGGTQVYVDRQRIDPDDYDADRDLPPHAIVIDGTDSEESSSYSFEIDGDVIRANYHDATVEDDDVIDGTSVQGTVDDSIDAYWFDGDIVDFTLRGDASVDVEYDVRNP